MRKCILLIPLVMAFAIPTWAQNKKVVYRKTQTVDFSETNIDGLVRSPDGAYLHQKRGVRFLPLYEVKQQFDKGIKESAEYLN